VSDERSSSTRARRLIAAVRLVHPGPTLAVVSLSAALGAILLAQAGRALDERWLFIVVAVAGSQVFTGATNDLADAERDLAAGRPEKPLPAGAISRRESAAVAGAGLALQVAASLALGILPLVLGLAAVSSAAAYNLLLSRTPLSPLPYLVSFALLPLWIAAGVSVDLARVMPAVPLASLFAGAAHLANTLRDFEPDAAGGSRSLAQVIGRRGTRLMAMGCLVGVGIGVGVTLIAGRAGAPSIALGAAGLAAVVLGARGERWLWYAILVAAVAWTAAWALATG
jgi:4-hydroxybenzoate polyprenyltransferase